MHISPCGVIPKSQPGKWRLIVDLSSPEGASINDGISKELCSLRYVSVEDVIPIIVKLGKDALLAYMDLESAYRIVPVHPEDRHLLGIRHDSATYVDAALPFGLRSAPKIFNALADGLEWIMIKHGVAHAIHYLDDFLFLGPPDSLVCQQSLTKALAICQNLGVPVAMHKCEGPATTLTFLGIELDTIEMEMRLPLKKLSRLQEIITSWRQKKSCLRKDLESLVGHLCHLCKVVRPGREFLRGMFQLLTNCKRKHYSIRLLCAFRADLEWWHFFLASWNGSSMLFPIKAANPDVHVWSDASGSWGAAAWCQGAWFQVTWQDFPQFEGVSIAAKELLPIVVGAAAWGSKWEGKTVCFHCDNAAVVAVLKGPIWLIC